MRKAFIIVVLLVIGGTALWCLLAPKKAALESGAACPPVRTALAALALAENPTARTYVTLGPGAAVFTNAFARAGLARVTDGAGRADLVFVSGDASAKTLSRAQAVCATNGLVAIHYDVRKLPFAAFRRELELLPEAPWRLWFPGRSDALVTVDAAGRRSCGPRLADMLELFSREGLFSAFARAGIDSLQTLLASYVGTRESVMPAFDAAQGEVVPECFVTKDVQPMDWIDASGVDADIREPLLMEIRSMQVVRRMVLQGDIQARAGNRDAAMEAWTKAIRRSPNDSLVLERICLLDVNAETFLKVGNFPMAAQCLETMVCLRPGDIPTLRRLACVFRQMNRKDKAALVDKRADDLAKIKLRAKGRQSK